MKILAFPNDRFGLGTTSLIYHLAHIFADRGVEVLAVDLDPQSTLTSMCLTDDEVEALWCGDDPARGTIFSALSPLVDGLGDLARFRPIPLRNRLSLLPSALRFSTLEPHFSRAWSRLERGDDSALDLLSSIHRVILESADKADLVLLDLGPGLHAIARTALNSADFLCVPWGPDLYATTSLTYLGPTLRGWHAAWESLTSNAPPDALPRGAMQPLGYVILHPGMHDTRGLGPSVRWMPHIPETFRTAFLGEAKTSVPPLDEDRLALASLRFHKSLMPLARNAMKPMFHLKSADGAMGTLGGAVRMCHRDYMHLSQRLAEAIGLTLDS